MEKQYQPTEHEQLIHRWKLAMRDGDIGEAAILRKEIEKDKPPKVEVVETEQTVEPKVEVEKVELPIKKKRGRPKKIV
jgi:hypothetical protein